MLKLEQNIDDAIMLGRQQMADALQERYDAKGIIDSSGTDIRFTCNERLLCFSELLLSDQQLDEK